MPYWKRTIRKARSGGIEGLPLQLMIMVVVAGIGMAIIMSWMSGLQPPASIGAIHTSPNQILLTDDDGDGTYEGSDLEILVTVVDGEGNGIRGATVILEGSGISFGDRTGTVYGLTNERGEVSFENLVAKRATGGLGYVTVSVTKSGYGTDSSLEIPVICE